MRRIDFAQVLYTAPEPEESEQEDPNTDASDQTDSQPEDQHEQPPKDKEKPEADAYQVRLFARLEQELREGSMPALQLVVLEDNGLATRTSFKHGTEGYTTGESALMRLEGAEPQVVSISESAPSPVTQENFELVLNSLFTTKPNTELPAELAQYFASPEVAEANSEEAPVVFNWLEKQVRP